MFFPGLFFLKRESRCDKIDFACEKNNNHNNLISKEAIYGRKSCIGRRCENRYR